MIAPNMKSGDKLAEFVRSNGPNPDGWGVKVDKLRGELELARRLWSATEELTVESLADMGFPGYAEFEPRYCSLKPDVHGNHPGILYTRKGLVLPEIGPDLPLVFMITAPPTAGQSTLVGGLKSLDGERAFCDTVVTATDRPPRNSVVKKMVVQNWEQLGLRLARPDADYIYMTKDFFTAMMMQPGFFLASTRSVWGARYAMPGVNLTKAIEERLPVVICNVDPSGIRDITQFLRGHADENIKSLPILSALVIPGAKPADIFRKIVGDRPPMELPGRLADATRDIVSGALGVDVIIRNNFQANIGPELMISSVNDFLHGLCRNGGT